MFRKFIAAFLMLFVSIPGLAAPAQANAVTVGVTAECAKKVSATMERMGTASELTIPGCGVIEQGKFVEYGATSPGRILGATQCRYAGGYTAYKNLFGVKVWHVTSRMRFCYNIADNKVTYFQDPPSVSFYMTSGFVGSIEGRDAEWVDEPNVAVGDTTSIVSLGWKGNPVGSTTVNHEIIVREDGSWDFNDWH